MKNFFKVITFTLTTLLSVTTLASSLHELAQKTDNASAALLDILAMPDREAPLSLLAKATCVATVPNVIRAGFIFGARYGKGMVSCRLNDGWSRPSFIEIHGGSWGAQIGVQSVDLVLVFVRPDAMQKFSKSNFTLGADASIAVGPVGRDAQAGTDYKLESEIYSYSRARGFFAGLTIQGTSITVSKADNAQVYGYETNAYELLTSDGRTSPNEVVRYVNSLISLGR